ncbi:MAG: hypothetical protein IJG94_02015 [Clostridia bacterium]|nr:hypothetical protein [Clostridia bacterium]
MQSQYERSYCFTALGEASLFHTASYLSTPGNMDAAMIVSALKEQICSIPFSDYLKRYVYQRSGMIGSFRKISQEKYVQTVLDAFQETGTPGSMRHPDTRLVTCIRRWFEQASVRRSAVLLLGFGLSMPIEDVNDFLTKAIHDHTLDEDNPLEAICAYCYRNAYRYAKMEQLWHLYERSSAAVEAQPAPAQPSGISDADFQFVRRLAKQPNENWLTPTVMKTRETFMKLYTEANQCIQNDRMSSGKASGPLPPHALEDVLCASIPRNSHGNLIPEFNSGIRETISGKRFSRQHIHELLHSTIEPTRYDLLTLCFFICASRVDQQPDPQNRYRQFVDDANRILLDCGFGPVYVADPYESFILICVLSVDPLGTYADVLEQSYADVPSPC